MTPDGVLHPPPRKFAVMRDQHRITIIGVHRDRVIVC
jgi:hypothetical protein